MTVQIYSTQVYNQLSNGVKAMIYGGSGVGKTRLARTLPNCIIGSAENGLLSLRKENLPFTPLRTLEECKEFYEWLLNDKKSRQFTSVALDSVSEIAESCLTAAKGRNKDPRKAYGEVQDEIVALLRAYRDLPGRNVYFIAKQEWIKDESTGGMIYGPSFPGNKLAQAVPYFFDEVFQLIAWRDPASGLMQSALKCHKDATSEGKDRSGALDLYEPADLSHVFRKIMGS